MDQKKLFLALCWQMELRVGPGWFIGVRDAAHLLAVNKDTVCAWYSEFCARDILKIVRPHTRTRAACYRFIEP
jgi:hypothetical protein